MSAAILFGPRLGVVGFGRSRPCVCPGVYVAAAPPGASRKAKIDGAGVEADLWVQQGKLQD